MTIVAAQLGMIGCAREQSSEETQGPLMSQATHPAAASLTEMPSLDSATEWLNSQPLTVADLLGKVVLVDFWTYTCINWIRQLPYVRAWAEKY